LGGDPNSKRPSLEERAFGIPIGDCLLKTAQGISSLKDLKQEDQSALLDEVLRLGVRLEQQRAAARANFQSVPTTLTQAEADSMKLDGIRAYLLEERTKILGTVATRSKRHELAVTLSQERIAFDYEESVSSAIRNLIEPTWQTSASAATAASSP
jgi:hypothetical protein